MDILETYIDRLNRLPVDLKTEVILADMVEDGISLDDVVVVPAGAFRRSVGRDLDGVEWFETSKGRKRWLRLTVNRDGLYDLLPEGVFHQPTTNDPLRTKEATLREMKIQQQREQAARQFFLPLEQEFYRQRIRLELEERRYQLDTDAVEISDHVLVQFWNLPNFLDTNQVKSVLYLLPMLHQFTGDLDRMALCLEQVLDQRVSLQQQAPVTEEIQITNSASETDGVGLLGDWQLGINTVLNGVYCDVMPSIRLTIHITQPDRIMSYLPGGRQRQVVEWFNRYLFPMETSVTITLDIDIDDPGFGLTDDDFAGRLDLTTYV